MADEGSPRGDGKDVSKAYGLKRVLHVEWDPETGTFSVRARRARARRRGPTGESPVCMPAAPPRPCTARRARAAAAMGNFRPADSGCGRAQGLPDVWAKALPAGMSRDETKAKKMPQHLAPPVPPKTARAREMARAAAGEGASISKPFNFQHEHHVQVDPESDTGFAGLPDAWKAMLKASAISRDDVAAHPQEVMDVLQFHLEGAPPNLPTRSSLDKACDEGAYMHAGTRAHVPCTRTDGRAMCSLTHSLHIVLLAAVTIMQEDPSTYFSHLRKLGEGCARAAMQPTFRQVNTTQSLATTRTHTLTHS